MVEGLRENLRGDTLFLTKDNPEMHYGISLTMCDLLGQAFDRAAEDDAVRAVVIDAAGPGFHRGAVMVTELAPSMEELGCDDFRQLVRKGQDLGRKIAGLLKPVIGIARAGALGGGLEMLLRSDFLYVLDAAELSFPEVSLGFVAAWGGTQWGGRMMPFRKAQEFLLLGEKISGKDAVEYGLATRSFPDEAALDEHVEKVLGRLQFCSPASFAETKRCLSAIWEGSLAHGEGVEVEAEIQAMATGDFLDAYNAWRAGKAWNYAAGEAQ